MGVYAFKTEILLKLLRWRYPTSNDFGSEIIPAAVTEHHVQVRESKQILDIVSPYFLVVGLIYSLVRIVTPYIQSPSTQKLICIESCFNRHIYSETIGKILGPSRLFMMPTWPLLKR